MRAVRIMIVILAAMLLCGCSAREMEDRMFAQAMEINAQEEGLIGGFGEFVVSGNNVQEIRENYQNQLDKYLDLGHIKAIVFGKELMEDAQRIKEVLFELEQMPIISRNSLVFAYAYEGEESYLAKLAREEEEPGKYLSDRYHNNPYQKSSAAVTLAELLGNYR